MLSHFSCVWLFVTLWTVACQTPLSMGFSRQEHWSPNLAPGDAKFQGTSLWVFICPLTPGLGFSHEHMRSSPLAGGMLVWKGSYTSSAVAHCMVSSLVLRIRSLDKINSFSNYVIRNLGLSWDIPGATMGGKLKTGVCTHSLRATSRAPYLYLLGFPLRFD